MVAESLEMTPAAVRQAKSRVLRRLREELHQLLEQEGCTLGVSWRRLNLVRQGVMTTAAYPATSETNEDQKSRVTLKTLVMGKEQRSPQSA